MNYFAFPATLTQVDGRATVTAYKPNDDAPLKTVDSNHPHFDDIVKGLRAGDESVWELFDVAAGVMSKFTKVTDRVSWNGADVLWDGDPIHNVLSEQLGRAISEGRTANYTALARFWERLEANPVAHSREQAYRFLASSAFQITADGLVVGFKGVVDNKDGTFSSTGHSQVKGKPSAYVNGVALPELTTVTQRIGDVVHMPRSEVVHDPSKSCERGLHVATHNYASGFGNTVMEVHIDPATICSVPDREDEKVRVWQYTVAGVARAKEAYEGSTVLQESPSTAAWAGDVGYKV